MGRPWPTRRDLKTISNTLSFTNVEHVEFWTLGITNLAQNRLIWIRMVFRSSTHTPKPSKMKQTLLKSISGQSSLEHDGYHGSATWEISKTWSFVFFRTMDLDVHEITRNRSVYTPWTFCVYCCMSFSWTPIGPLLDPAFSIARHVLVNLEK